MLKNWAPTIEHEPVKIKNHSELLLLKETTLTISIKDEPVRIKKSIWQEKKAWGQDYCKNYSFGSGEEGILSFSRRLWVKFLTSKYGEEKKKFFLGQQLSKGAGGKKTLRGGFVSMHCPGCLGFSVVWWVLSPRPLGPQKMGKRRGRNIFAQVFLSLQPSN